MIFFCVAYALQGGYSVVTPRGKHETLFLSVHSNGDLDRSRLCLAAQSGFSNIVFHT
jgi:hypothetical protein